MGKFVFFKNSRPIPVESSMSATPSLQSSCLVECVFVGLGDRVQHRITGGNDPLTGPEHRSAVSCRGFGFEYRLGCQWGYHRVWFVRSPITFVDFVISNIYRCIISSGQRVNWLGS